MTFIDSTAVREFWQGFEKAAVNAGEFSKSTLPALKNGASEAAAYLVDKEIAGLFLFIIPFFMLPICFFLFKYLIKSTKELSRQGAEIAGTMAVLSFVGMTICMWLLFISFPLKAKRCYVIAKHPEAYAVEQIIKTMRK